jgi:hypothetical protein
MVFLDVRCWYESNRYDFGALYVALRSGLLVSFLLYPCGRYGHNKVPWRQKKKEDCSSVQEVMMQPLLAASERAKTFFQMPCVRGRSRHLNVAFLCSSVIVEKLELCLGRNDFFDLTRCNTNDR